MKCSRPYCKLISNGGTALTKTFLHRKAALVVIHNDGNATVRAELREPLLLLDVLRNVDGLPCVVLAIGLLQFLENNAGFPAIGCAECEELDALVGFQASWSLVVRHVGT
jgi:hypothetical protein